VSAGTVRSAGRPAGYLDGVRRRCARQASGKVLEHIDQIAAIPTQTFEADIPGNLFLEIRAMLCADRVYLLEVVGRASSHAEAGRCLDGVSIGGESPLPADVISGLSQTMAQTGELRAAYERGRGLGRLIGAGLVVIVVAGVIAIIFSASRSRRKLANQTSSAVPPPIPS